MMKKLWIKTMLSFTCFCLLIPISFRPAQAINCDKDAPMSRGATWSPDGKQIVFDSNRDGIQEIYIMNSDGSNVKRLTYTKTAKYLPSISSDGKKVLFMSYSDSEEAVYVMNIDGNELRKLTDENSRNGDPDWSSDSKQIVFHSDRDEEEPEIYVMDADGTNVKRLTRNKFRDYVPRWSPDGTMISFNTTRDGNREIYLMSSDGTNQRNVTNDPLSNMVHNWSPDSKKIIFYAFSLQSAHLKNTNLSKDEKSALVRTTAEIFVTDLDGRNRIQLTHNYFWDQGPVFSPDGSKILFESCRSGNRETYVMDADGSNVKRLTFSTKSE